MNATESLDAASRLSKISYDYPDLSIGINALIHEVLRESDSRAEAAGPVASSNGHAAATRPGVNYRLTHDDSLLPSPPTHGNGRVSAVDKAMSAKLLPGLTVPEKEWLTLGEFAFLANRSVFSIGDYCRNGRLKAKKGSGYNSPGSPRWLIHRTEMDRYKAAGLLKHCPCRNQT